MRVKARVADLLGGVAWLARGRGLDWFGWIGWLSRLARLAGLQDQLTWTACSIGSACAQSTSFSFSFSFSEGCPTGWAAPS
jgi:hypothetical protein